MEKGKLKKEKRYLSIVLVPHFSDSVRKIRISSLLIKIIGSALILLTVSLICFTIYTTNQNGKLKSNISQLSDLNAEQQKMLQQKAKTITSLEQNKIKASQTAKDFLEKYREITDNYITSRSGTSRISSGQNSTSFMEDLKNLKELMNGFNKIVDSNESLSSSLSGTETKLNSYIRSIPTEWPASGTVTSYFDIRKDPFTRAKKFHEGLDIGASYGKSIRAAGDGTVTFSGRKGSFGNCIIISHGHGLKTLYGHCSKLLASEGKKVKKGQLIARVGSTGRSTGSHLHFGIYLYGSPVNPLKYLDK
ncbi:MAG TPA: peptidoglycan DD-metalloendopeptidase family protein [Clostridia bacterium]|nr:peptidoglycan DD-metalloendopeptidase family protein [Clostridia bacterium]